MSPMIFQLPTTSLPHVTVSGAALAGLKPALSRKTIGHLLAIAARIGAAQKRGDAKLLKVLGQPADLTLDILDLVVHDPQLIELVFLGTPDYSARWDIRDATTALSTMRLYWFDYHTARYLRDCGEVLSMEQLEYALRALQFIGEMVDESDEFNDIKLTLGGEPRRDPQNNNCLVLNHRQLNRLLIHPMGMSPLHVWAAKTDTPLPQDFHSLRWMLRQVDLLTRESMS